MRKIKWGNILMLFTIIIFLFTFSFEHTHYKKVDKHKREIIEKSVHQVTRFKAISSFIINVSKNDTKNDSIKKINEENEKID